MGDVESLRVRRVKGWDANWTAPDTPLVRAREAAPALCYGPQPTWSAGIDDYAEEAEVLRCASLYALTALTFLTAP